HLQGCGDDGDRAAPDRALASGLPAPDRRRHQAQPGEADDRPQARGHRSFHVEEQGEVRPDEAPQARVMTRLTWEGVGPRPRHERWRCTWRRARFEGEHPLGMWPERYRLEVPRVGYAPSEYQTKQWPEEALIEGWFPLSAREHACFDLVEGAGMLASPTEERT